MKSIYILLLLSLALASCSTDKPENLEPTVRTLDATDITRTSATLHGSVSGNGNDALLQLSFRYGNSSTMASSSESQSMTNGNVDMAISNLSPGTTYTYQLQASNGHATIHGNTLTFTTVPLAIPTIGAIRILSYGATSAMADFDISDDGGANIEEAGCYLMDGSNAALDTVKARKFVGKMVSTDNYRWQSIINGLTANTSYTVYPYAASPAGKGLGAGTTLTTGDATILASPGDFAKMMTDGMTFDSLTIAGPMNGDDLAKLRTINVRNLDMAEVQIVSGGGPYNGTYYTQDNVVGQQLFEGCTSLESLTIPTSATEVMPSSGCTALQSIKVSPANTTFKSEAGVLTNYAATSIIWFPVGKTGSYTAPSTITSISSNAFRGCNITTITLPDKLHTIPTGAFLQCTRLQTVRLGKSVDLISNYAFDGCPLADLYIEATEPPVCYDNTFSTSGVDFTQTCTLHVPKGSIAKYRRSSAWSIFASITEE